MTFPLIQIGFVALTLGAFAFLFIQIKSAVNKTEWSYSKKVRFNLFFSASLIIWTLFVSIWSLSGRMGSFQIFPFNLMPVFVVPLIAIVAFVFSRSGKEVLQLIPIENIIRIQVFRFFVELLLWALYLENQAPVQMTFERHERNHCSFHCLFSFQK
jgi:hypothetical protein